MEVRARARKLTLSEWVRAELLEPRGEGQAAANEVLLGELLALRTLFLNLMFSLTNGKAVTPEWEVPPSAETSFVAAVVAAVSAMLGLPVYRAW